MGSGISLPSKQFRPGSFAQLQTGDSGTGVITKDSVFKTFALQWNLPQMFACS